MLLNAFIAIIIRSTCFRHLNAHHQELETILVLLPHMVCKGSVMYVLCLWELYYCVSLAVRRAECVKCVEGVWCSCWCIACGYVGAGVLLEWRRFTVQSLGCWWSAVRSREAGYASGMREIVQLTLSRGAWAGWMASLNAQATQTLFSNWSFTPPMHHMTESVAQFSSSRTHSLLPCNWPPTTSNQGITHHMW